MSEDHSNKKPKPLSEYTEEDLEEIGTTSFMFSLALSEVVNVAYYAGVERKVLHDAIDQLYDAISAQLKEKAN